MKKFSALKSLLGFRSFEPYYEPKTYEWVVNTFFKRSVVAEDVANLIARLIPRSKAVIVDMAAGTGLVSLPLMRLGYRVIAIDIDQQMLDEVKQKAESAALEDVRIVRQNINFFSNFPDNSVDGYTCMAANRYIVNLDVFLSEIYRTLKPGGYFVWPIFASDYVHWKLAAGFRQPVFSWTLAKLMKKKGYINVKIDKFDSMIRNTMKGVPIYAIPTYIIAQKKA